MAKINIKYHILKPANHFYLLYNLSRWHFSCRPSIYDYWPQKVGGLSDREKEAIADFKKIILKHKLKLWRIFVCASYQKAWERADKSEYLSKVETNKLRKIFKTTSIIFERVWRTEGKNLRKWLPIISEYSKDSLIIKDLIVFFGPTKFKNINVLLLMGGDRDGGGGGANIKGNWVEAEIGLNTTNLLPIKNVLWHEITHRLYTNRDNKIINEYVEKNPIEKEITDLGRDKEGIQFIYETVTASLFPRGFLAEKHFRRRNQKMITKNNIDELKKIGKDPFMAERFVVAKHYRSFKKYFEKGLPFDENYIRIIHRGYLEYLEIFK